MTDLLLIELAWQLDRLRWVPTPTLDRIVRRDGLCFWRSGEAEPPEPSGLELPDRELASAFCAGCPVLNECLELELRSGGEQTLGIWGGMCEDDRRELHRFWLQRGDRAGRRGGEA